MNYYIFKEDTMILETKDIEKIIPHRNPFLLVDRILEVEPGKRAVGIKNVTANEPFFQGHFPGNPIMPGVLIVEALAQTACVAALLDEANKGKLGVFAAIDSMKFKKLVTPGDTLRLETEVTAFKLNIAVINVKATVDGKLAAEGVIRCALIKQE
jgi:3-hydroxyacyl-[acyl-carrier-protein] dehydratase